MALFQPISGIRYDPDRVDLADVLAPPYDVIDEDSRASLEARSPYNAVFVELGRNGAERDRYEQATCHFDQWLADGILVVDEEPSFYVYRMGWHDEAGRAHQTTGIMGALEVSTPDEGRVLPHERTMGKPKGDRLRLLRACRANLSPVWGLSLAEGLSDLCQMAGPPVARATDDDGVHHRLWRITQPGVVTAITDAVASAPVMIADGHHRYETALAYRDERRAETGDVDGDYDQVFAFVVELSEDQLQVQPIHRVISGLPDDFDLVGVLAHAFDVIEVTDPPGAATAGADADPDWPEPGAIRKLTDRMATAGALALLAGERAWLLRPRVAAGEDHADDPDSLLLDAALAGLPDHQLDFHHSAEMVANLAWAGKAQAAVLVRPVAVRQIAAAARAGHRMPPKTTFFAPKPRTGLVFRRLHD